MTQARPGDTRSVTKQAEGLNITVRTGTGSGRTMLSAFDHALQRAGVADFNLVTLSSVIPPGSRIRTVDALLAGGHGDLLFCVRAQAFAEHPGDIAWAGLGWCVDETGAGLFVEHHGGSEQSVIEQIELSLADMKHNRDGAYGQVHMAVSSAHCIDLPVCALVLAAYRVSSWHEPEGSPPSPRGYTASEPEALVPAAHVPAPTPAASAQPTPAVPGVRITVEGEIDDATGRLFYQLYRDAFGELETQAVARQVLHESEFLEEMLDPRVHKYVAWNDDGEAIGMSTLTSDLATVPWISPAYFEHHYPEHHARNAIYYMGFTLVHPEHRGARVYHAMFRPMVELMIAERGVVAWDICLVNDDRGLGGNGARLLESLADVTIVPVDRQTYYAGTFHGPLPGAPQG